jgi:hypothetical protein
VGEDRGRWGKGGGLGWGGEGMGRKWQGIELACTPIEGCKEPLV